MNSTGDGLVWTIVIAAVVNLAATVLAQFWGRHTSRELARQEREDQRIDKLVDVFVAVRATTEKWERATQGLIEFAARGRQALDQALTGNPTFPGAVTVALTEDVARLHLMVKNPEVKRAADELMSLVVGQDLTQAVDMLIRLGDAPPESRIEWRAKADRAKDEVVAKAREILSYGEAALGYDLPKQQRAR